MGNNVSPDEIMLQEALKRALTSLTSPDVEANGDNDGNSDNNPGEEGETMSEHEFERILKLAEGLHRVRGGELDSDRQAEYDDFRAILFSERAQILVDEFRRTDSVESIEKAVELRNQALSLTPEGDVKRAERLIGLGTSLFHRFERLGDPADVNRAIEYETQAVRLTPDGHEDKPRWLINLGSSYHSRFTRFGEVADMEKAHEYLSQAVLLIPAVHAIKPTGLNNLGISYQCRFERLGELADVDKGIECQTRAMLLTPDGHADKPTLLTNLGSSYHLRFERLKEVADLNRAIECLTQAVLLTPDGTAKKPSLLNNLGISYRSRFERLGEVADVDKAIECQSQAVLLGLDGHALKPSWLHNLGNSYRRRFERLGELADIDKAIECQTRAVLLTLDGHSDRPVQLKNLGNSYMCRFESLGQHSDLESAQASFQSAALHIVTHPSQQIMCARRWAECTHSLGTSPLPAYERCMELIPRVIWLGTTISQRYNLLSTISDLVAEAASWAISAQEYDLAIEWLEQGRSVVWSQILQLRTPCDDLSVVDPSLAQYLTSIAAELEGAGTRPTERAPSNSAPEDQEKIAQRHRYLADEWEKTLAKARKIPGFEHFMRPRKAEELKRAATIGPVVLINIHSTRCDALIIFPQCDEVAHIVLAEDLSPEIAEGSQAQSSFSTRRRGEDDRGFARMRQTSEPEDPLKRQLADLWSAIVNPVLDGLACTRQLPIDERPHVTWCATGWLALLPLHAAGLYDGSTPNACDLVISSYTPTLSALLTSGSSTPVPGVGILAVGQQWTRGLPPLPYTVKELAEIEKHAKSGGYHQLDEDKATVDAVLGGMDEHSWVHLACHASQDPNNPAQSAFHLHNGKLTLEAITKRQYKNKGLAFLSACETAAGDGELPDEAVHLAAGMLMAGYPSVIATIWPICDVDGPEVAGRVYAELLNDGKMDHRGAARALHKAVAGLREKIGANSFKRWVPFVHIGV